MTEYDPIRFGDDDDENGDENDKGETGESAHHRALAQRLLASRTIIISRPVDDKLAASVIAQLRILEDDDAKKPITFIVNSPGGSADSGFAIHDYGRFIKPPIRSIVTGICASAAVMIHLAADKQNRYCTPASRFLLHQPSMGARGQASDLEILSAEIDRIKALYNDIVARETGRSAKQVEKDVHRDYWIPASNAVEYGLVKAVVANRSEIE
ncbi:MAG: ATP-dependent Clp protease proteolytic subunit [Planctomycetes bacterium]|nr:ATP-dependent Clp protease proteolytic subunit [Planctomycetota bacterium]MCW8136913.1 ATP-dependent Clp protease proteolytic subunit [Planctomycetota bacterium]